MAKATILLFKGRPLRQLTRGATKTGGRNNQGRITSFHRGGGTKQSIRDIDMKRSTPDLTGTVERIEYDPFRTGRTALIRWDGDRASGKCRSGGDGEEGEASAASKAHRIKDVQRSALPRGIHDLPRRMLRSAVATICGVPVAQRKGREPLTVMIDGRRMFSSLAWEGGGWGADPPFFGVYPETRFSLHQGLTLYNNDPSHLSSFGVNLHRRCVSTVGHPDDIVDQGSSTVPGDTLLPERIKVKRLDKTAKHIMNILDKEALDEVRSERNIPDIKAGYIVEIKVEAPENKGRISTVKGLVIAKRNSGIATTIRVRRLESSVGTESILPLYSPNIKDIKVLEKRSVRRAKLYYIRERPYNVALRELAQRTAKKKEMVLRAKRAEQSKKK